MGTISSTVTAATSGSDASDAAAVSIAMVSATVTRDVRSTGDDSLRTISPRWRYRTSEPSMTESDRAAEPRPARSSPPDTRDASVTLGRNWTSNRRPTRENASACALRSGVTATVCSELPPSGRPETLVTAAENAIGGASEYVTAPLIPETLFAPWKTTRAPLTCGDVAVTVWRPEDSPRVQSIWARPSWSVTDEAALSCADGSDFAQFTAAPGTGRSFTVTTRTTSGALARAGPFTTVCASPDT